MKPNPTLRTALAASALALASVSLPVLAQTKTLKVVAHADLKILDPTFTTAYITRNFGYMVYDTLFAQDASGKPQPQMVEKYSSAKDGKQWSFTLRPGLKFSDGSAVTAADAVASLQRWGARDSLGRAMGEAGAEWKALDARSFTLTLKEPFGMVLDALAKPSGFPPVILPERLARMPATAPLPEVMGSGPFVFKRDEWVPGNKAVFVRNPNYVARSEPASGLAGSKKSQFDRVEWLYLPDANSAIAALKRGEVDLVEQVPPDYIAPLRADASVKIGSGGAYQGVLVMNQLHPPFNNPKVRQAFLQAVSQERFTAAMGYPLDMRMNYCASTDCEFRPDGFYGLSKMWGEGLARLYWDKHGIESVCVRIGSCVERPQEFRHLSTWLGHEDLVHLIEQGITVPDLGFLVVWGVSANARSCWNNDGAARLRYQPKQNAEDFAEEILAGPNPLDAIGRQYQGGSFASIDFTPEAQRHGGARK